MTHKDIFTKFMIEYDKANVTSSYPSLTEYEIATVLDKAYMALISQKVTGNNVRRAPFEADIKSISDLQPLVVSRLLFLGTTASTTKAHNFYPKTTSTYVDDQGTPLDSSDDVVWQSEVRSMPDNMRSVKMPYDMLYFVAASVPVDMHTTVAWQEDLDLNETNKIIHPIDNKDSDYQERSFKRYRLANANLLPHQAAKKFYASSSNIPWIKNPIVFLENNRVNLLVDPCFGIPELSYVDPDTNETKYGEWMNLSYIRKPFKFAKNIEELKNTLDNRKIEIKYAIEGEYHLIVNVDEYLASDKRKLHIDDIRVYNPDDQETVIGSERLTYYVEFNADRYDASMLKAEDFVAGNTIFGNTVRCSAAPLDMDDPDPEIYDDSFKLNPDNSFAVIRKNADGLTCSQLFVVTYKLLYDAIKSRITNVNEDLYNFGYYTDEAGTDALGTHYNMNFVQFVPIDVDGSDYSDELLDAYKNVKEWGQSEYKLESEDIHSGTILKDVHGNTLDDYYTFELDDVAAEELISLAITYALENVESPRLNAHLGIRGLES